MRRVRVLAVGRPKAPHWREAVAHYQKSLLHRLEVEELFVKDADAKLAPLARKQAESARLNKQVHRNDVLICLDEKGKNLTSCAFADFLQRLFNAAKVPCFCIGGAYGLSEDILQAAPHRISFGLMTFPHELARVLLWEQLYRAEQILAGTGYHHE